MINNKFMQVIGPNAIKDINQKLGQIKDDVMNDIKNMKIVKGTKSRMNRYVKLKIEKMLMNYLKKLPPKIKDELKDPAMCKCLQKFIDDTVDNFWPDLEEYILFEFRMSMNKPVLNPTERKSYPCICLPCGRFRDCFRYNYDPVDQVIWTRIKSFWFWVILLVESFPFYAVQPLFKGLVWLMLDKSDQFQLVQFILNFKTLQFFTLGCIGSVLGYVSYFGCITIYTEGKIMTGD